MINITELNERLNASFKGQLELSENSEALYVKKESIVEVLNALKEKFDYKRLLDVTSADYEDRFEMIYHLMNDEMKILEIKVRLAKDDNKVSSIASVWLYAERMEREVYDLMGILFEGHENLERILNTEDFVGHPLQKSFKLDIEKRF
jgi:NADH-quinone oxidoreductase subunit C